MHVASAANSTAKSRPPPPATPSRMPIGKSSSEPDAEGGADDSDDASTRVTATVAGEMAVTVTPRDFVSASIDCELSVVAAAVAAASLGARMDASTTTEPSVSVSVISAGTIPLPSVAASAALKAA